MLVSGSGRRGGSCCVLCAESSEVCMVHVLAHELSKCSPPRRVYAPRPLAALFAALSPASPLYLISLLLAQPCPGDQHEYGGRGNRSSGDCFTAAPNIDHSQPFVKRDISDWLCWLREHVGFDGWRCVGVCVGGEGGERRSTSALLSAEAPVPACCLCANAGLACLPQPSPPSPCGQHFLPMGSSPNQLRPASLPAGWTL